MATMNDLSTNLISKDDLYLGLESHNVSLRLVKPFLRHLAKTPRAPFWSPPVQIGLTNSKNNRFGCLPVAFTLTGKLTCYQKRKPLVLIFPFSKTLPDVPSTSVPCITLLDAEQPASSNKRNILI